MNENKTLLGRLIAAVVGIFHKASPIVDQVVQWSDNLVNLIKQAEASEAGQLLEVGIEAIFPATIPLISAFKLWLPKIGALISGTHYEMDKTDKQQLEDLLKYLSTLKTSDPVLYAGVLNTLNAAIQQFFTANQGINLPVSQSLAIAQVYHDPSLGTSA